MPDWPITGVSTGFSCAVIKTERKNKSWLKGAFRLSTQVVVRQNRSPQDVRGLGAIDVCAWYAELVR
jgi:hypothetical protein